MTRLTMIVLALVLSTAALKGQWIQTNGPEGGNIAALGSVGNTVLAATWPDALYRLDTLSNRWNRIGTRMIERLDVVHGIIIASTDQGLQRSTDLGDSWTPVGPTAGTVIEAVDGSDFYASDGPTLYVSIDRGLNWREFGGDWATTGTHQGDVLSLTTRGNIIVVVGDMPMEGVVRSFDAGQNWHVVGTGLPVGSTVRNVRFLKDTLLAQVLDPASHRSLGIYISTDFGTTWSEMNEGRVEHERGYSPVFFFYLEGSAIAASTVRGTIRLEGDRWVGTNDNLASAVTSDADGRIYRGDFSGLSRSDDNGTTWERFDRGMLSQHITAITGSGRAVIAASGNGIHRSLDNGLTWTTTTGRVRAEMFAHRGSVILAQGSRNTEQGIVRSLDTGATWSDANIGITHPLPWLSSIAATEEIAYAALHAPLPFNQSEQLYEGGLYRSTDAGETWTLTGNGLPERSGISLGIVAVAAHERTVVAITFDSVYRSTDDGQSWTVGGVGLPRIWTIRGLVENQGRFYLASGTHVWVSEDGGLNWAIAGGAGFSEMVYSISKYGNTVAAIVGGDVGQQDLHRLATDRWVPLGEPLPSNAIGRGVVSVNGTTFLATGNRSVMKMAGSAGVEEERSALATTWAPLPIRNEARVSFTLASPGEATVELYDITGTLALRHNAGRLGIGSYEIVIPVERLPAGVYGYRISTTGESARGSVVIAR